MVGVLRHKILIYLLAFLYAGVLTGQAAPFTVAPADPVQGCHVAAITVDAMTVLLSELPEGCAAGGGVILPISTPQLTATRLDPTLVSLRWKTFDNDYTNRWMLQRRSDQRNEFISFWELTDNTVLEGDRIDNNDYAGTSYYRLYGISPEGEEVYSSVVAVGDFRRTGQLLVYPNPVTALANISLPGVAFTAELTLVDGLGRIVWRAVHPAGGPALLRLPGLTPGAYLLRWEDASGKVAATRFLKTGR